MLLYIFIYISVFNTSFWHIIGTSHTLMNIVYMQEKVIDLCKFIKKMQFDISRVFLFI